MMKPTETVAYDIGKNAAAMLYVLAFVKFVQFFALHGGADDLRMLVWLAGGGLCVSAVVRWMYGRATSRWHRMLVGGARKV